MKKICNRLVELAWFVDSTQPEIELLYKFECEFPKDYSKEKKIGRLKTIQDIIRANGISADIFKLVEEYYSIHDQFRKIEIRRGIAAVEDLRRKYSSRPITENHVSCFIPKFWMKYRGMSEADAILTVRDLGKKGRDAGIKSRASKNSRIFSPLCVEYWIHNGYSDEESERLVAEEKSLILRSYDNMEKIHGKEEGDRLMGLAMNKRKETLLSRYGVTTVSSPVSKESIKFFLPLYDMLLDSGISKDDIITGIYGEREFATHYEGRNYFYDLVIKSKKIVIEYNNTFWHPRDDKHWNNPFIDLETKLITEKLKLEALTSRDFEFIIVWNDEDHVVRRNEIMEIINGK